MKSNFLKCCGKLKSVFSQTGKQISLEESFSSFEESYCVVCKKTTQDQYETIENYQTTNPLDENQLILFKKFTELFCSDCGSVKEY